MSAPPPGARSPPGGLRYHIGTRQVALFPHPQVFVVRYAAEARAADGRGAGARRLPEDVIPLAFLPRDDLNVYRSHSAAACLEHLREHDPLAHGCPAYRHSQERGDPVILTPRLMVQFRTEMGIERILSAVDVLGLRLIEPLAYAAPNGFLLEVAPGVHGIGAIEAANTLVEEGLVLFAEPDLVQLRHWRAPAPAPDKAGLLGRQWHLRASGVLDAWEDNHGSPTIRVALFDDGLDTSHPEFLPAVATGQPKIAAQFDFATGALDATPKSYLDRHGTACAGVAVAAGVKAAGAAPGCRLVVARTPDFLGVADEARMFQWAADAGADVLSCSWGPVDGWGLSCPLPTPTRMAIRYCLRHGRGGKGMTIFWAAGNGAEAVTPDGYASNPDVLAIGACTEHGEAAPYSDFGPELFACAPSSGAAGDAAIVTTDLPGPAGYGGTLGGADVQGNYTDDFGGTSAAAPLAAGIAALALSANPALGAHELRALLRATADRIGPAGDYDAQGHSPRFGYGRLNAARAVAAARARQAATALVPTIDGPEAWSRTDEAPLFHVNPGPRAYYVVEVATQPELFDTATHGAERNADNFYGSWADQPFQTNPSFQLPEAAWLRLRAGTRLWYRVGASASAAGYVDYAVSTPDDQASSAPAIALLPGLGAPPSQAREPRRTVADLMRMVSTGAGKAGIDGPLVWDPRLGSPVFRITLGRAVTYAVEVANQQEYFATTAPGAAPPGRGYYRSGWVEPAAGDGDTVRIGFEAHALPLAAWDVLLGTRTLFYRLTVRDGQGVTPGRVYVMNLTSDAPGPLGSGEPGRGRADEERWRTPPPMRPPTPSPTQSANPTTLQDAS